MNAIEAKKAKRLLFLNRLYEITDGSEDMMVDMWGLGEEIGLTRDETSTITDYLRGEHLLEFKALGGGIGITHFGVTQVEAALSTPDEPSQYFPPAVNIIHVQQMSNSVIQQATHDSSQTASFAPESTNSLKDFLTQLATELPKLSLSEQDRSQAGAQVATIEAQLNAPHPNPGIIKAAGNVLHAILLGVAGNLSTDLLIHLAGFG